MATLRIIFTMLACRGIFAARMKQKLTKTDSNSNATKRSGFRYPFQAMSDSCSGAVVTTTCLDGEGYDDIANGVRAVLDGLSSECGATFCPRGDVVACWVRIAGHDFMDYDPTADSEAGGADGCIDFNDHDNDGLPECLYGGDNGVSLNDVYQKFCTQISLADFIVLAAEVAMDWSRTAHGLSAFSYTTGSTTNTFKSAFLYGRTTASTCNGFNKDGQSRLPNPEHGCPENERVFVENLGLTWDETTALMGAHTLGRAELKFSGYKGWWVDPERGHLFDNEYYRSILGKGWIPELNVIGLLKDSVSAESLPQHLSSATSKHQWQRGDAGRAGIEDPAHEMMLNTDLCLAFTRGPETLGHSDEDEGEYLAQSMNKACCSWTFSNPLATWLPEFAYCDQAAGAYQAGQSGGNIEFEMCCGLGDRHDIVRGTTDRGQPFNCGEPGGTDAAPGNSAVKRFAKDEDAWFKTYGPAWTKATQIGQTNMKSLADKCVDGQPAQCDARQRTSCCDLHPWCGEQDPPLCRMPRRGC